MSRTLTRILTGVATTGALVLTGLASTPATAQQAGDMGNTRVAIAPHVAKTITAAGITASPYGGAKAFAFEGTVALRFAISDTAGSGNRILHTGGVRLATEHASLALKRFRINLKQGMVSALINGDSRAKLFKIVKSNRPKLGDVRLTLNGAAADALNSTFGVDAFDAGDNFAFATVNAA